MAYLIVTSLVWAFSFGLIKKYLVGLDSSFVAAVRLLLSALVFIPFMRLPRTRRTYTISWLALIGAIQFGLMYVAYLYAFQFLKAYQVALFTITTPLYIAIIDGLLERKTRLMNWITALLTIAGSGIIVFKRADFSGFYGLALIQVSNLCFAAGQIMYRRHMKTRTEKSVKLIHDFGFLYLGGAIITSLFVACTATSAVTSISVSQLLVLLYLGVIASGVGFFLWNIGATKVSIATLAVANNLKIPLGIAVSILVFSESADYPRLALGGGILVIALWLAASVKSKARPRAR